MESGTVMLCAWVMAENKSDKILTFKLRPKRWGVSQLRSRRSAGCRHSVFKGPEVERSLVPWGKKKGWWGKRIARETKLEIRLDYCRSGGWAKDLELIIRNLEDDVGFWQGRNHFDVGEHIGGDLEGIEGDEAFVIINIIKNSWYFVFVCYRPGTVLNHLPLLSI